MPTRKALAWLICLSFYTWTGSGEKVSYKAGQEAGLVGRLEPDLACSKTGFPGCLSSKESACNEGDSGSIPGLGRSPGGGNGTNSSILAWRIPWTEEPGGLQSMRSQRVGHDWAHVHDWNYRCTGIQEPYRAKEPGSSLHCMAFTWLSSYASFWSLLILSPLLRTGSLTLSLLCCLVAKSCPTICNPTDCSMPGFPVLHYLPESAPDSSCCLFRHLIPSWLWLWASVLSLPRDLYAFAPAAPSGQLSTSLLWMSFSRWGPCPAPGPQNMVQQWGRTGLSDSPLCEAARQGSSLLNHDGLVRYYDWSGLQIIIQDTPLRVF